jgi:ABC-2 type transport system permease protein
MVVLVLFGMTSPLMAKMIPQIMTLVPGGESFVGLIPEPTIQDAVTQYVKNVTQFGILLVLVLGMGAVAAEKDKGTAAMVISKPMSRASFLLAKFCALSLTFLLAIAVAGAACYYYTYYLFGSLPAVSWLRLNGLILLYLVTYVAIALFFSTLTRTQYVAIGLSFGTLILFGVLAGFPGLADKLPSALISNAAALMLGQTSLQWTGLWVSLALIAVCLTGSWLVFRRQEL